MAVLDRLDERCIASLICGAVVSVRDVDAIWGRGSGGRAVVGAPLISRSCCAASCRHSLTRSTSPSELAVQRAETMISLKRQTGTRRETESGLSGRCSGVLEREGFW